MDLEHGRQRTVYRRFPRGRARTRSAGASAKAFLWRTGTERFESMAVPRFKNNYCGQRSSQSRNNVASGWSDAAVSFFGYRIGRVYGPNSTGSESSWTSTPVRVQKGHGKSLATRHH